MADSVARRGAAPGRLGRAIPAGSPSAQRRYLSFLVAGITMGMDLAAVQEVAEVPPMCRIPRPAGAAEYLAVVRGRAVLVVDLRRRLGLVNPVTDQRTRLIVTAGLARPWALLVDAATEVLTVDAIPPDTEASPGAGLRADLFAGSIPAHGRRLFLPDLGKVLGSP
jgi:chemotaxis signal transduction protein